MKYITTLRNKLQPAIAVFQTARASFKAACKAAAKAIYLEKLWCRCFGHEPPLVNKQTPYDLEYCPYCRMVVKVKKVR